MTGYVLIALSAAVPTLAVFLATFAFLRVRRENDSLRDEIDALRARIHADEAARSTNSQGATTAENGG